MYSSYDPDTMGYSKYCKMSDDCNKLIIETIHKLYTLGCWIQDMNFIPPYGICFDVKCSVKCLSNVSDDDCLRSELATRCIKDTWGYETCFHIDCKVEYTEDLVNIDDLRRAIQAMIDDV